MVFVVPPPGKLTADCMEKRKEKKKKTSLTLLCLSPLCLARLTSRSFASFILVHFNLRPPLLAANCTEHIFSH